MSGFRRCTACGFWPADRAHLRTRARGAGWEPHEWIPLCRRHHVEQGTIGWSKFCEKYPRVMQAIDERGWEIGVFFGVRRLVRK